MSRPLYRSCFKIAGRSGRQITVVVEIQWKLISTVEIAVTALVASVIVTLKVAYE